MTPCYSVQKPSLLYILKATKRQQLFLFWTWHRGNMDGFQLLRCIKWLRFWICLRCECMKLQLSTPCSTGAAIVIVFEHVQSTSPWKLINIRTTYKIKHKTSVTLWELTWCRSNTETAKYMFKPYHKNTKQNYYVLVCTQQII